MSEKCAECGWLETDSIHRASKDTLIQKIHKFTPAPPEERYRCEGCGEEFDSWRVSHGNTEHARSCDGYKCGPDCPVEVECGPITKVFAPAPLAERCEIEQEDCPTCNGTGRCESPLPVCGECGGSRVHSKACSRAIPAPLADGDTWCAECGETVPAGDAHQHTDAERAPLADGGIEELKRQLLLRTKECVEYHDEIAALRERVAKLEAFERDNLRIRGEIADNLRARVAELERVIEEAPHDTSCAYVTKYLLSGDEDRCDCFKSKAKVSG